MQIVDLILSYAHLLNEFFKHPLWLWGIPAAFVILAILTFRTFVKYSMEEDERRRLKRMRWFVFLMRWLAVSLIFVAIATPYTDMRTESDGNPQAIVLVDKSGSMENYDTSLVPTLTREISARLPTKVKEFGTSTDSPIGDAMLGQDAHLLIISDGNANSGVSLMDVAQVAAENNYSINSIKLLPVKRDAAVMIDAPASVPVGYPAEIRVIVSSTDGKAVPLVVTVDGTSIHNAPVAGPITLSPSLATGYHTIEARIEGGDANGANDVFFSVINVLEKPKVLLVSKAAGPLATALNGLFDTTIVPSLPADPAAYNDYTVVVVEDVPAKSLGDAKSLSALAEFLRDEQGGKYGNGLVVLGGFNSYDRGNYQGTSLESLLPVKVGKPKRTIGENNLVFVIQVSGSTGGTKIEIGPNGERREVTESIPTVDIIKAQAVSAINSLNLKNNVGVVVFGVNTAGQDAGSAEETMQKSVVRLAEIKPLYNHKQELIENIPRIQGGGTTAPDIALRTAVDMLKDKQGDKTIILLTNGRFSAGLGTGDNTPMKANTLAVIENARIKYNIKTQTLGVGSTDNSVFTKQVDESFLITAAKTGDSTYDRATNMASLMIKYGDPTEKGFGEAFHLVALSLTHFITRDVALEAVLNGFNEVVPKDGSRMLVTTDSGAPALTTWNYFNGRVASVTVFTASGLGPLLSPPDSDLIRNTVLWAAGDPTRKLEVRTDVPKAIVGQRAEITFVSKQPVSGSCTDTPLQFERSSGDSYVFSFTPEKTGFGAACGVPYAVNAQSEYWTVGLNDDLSTAVGITDGGVFAFDEVDAIVERITTVSKRVTSERKEIRNPFIALAIILFLMEVFVRRMWRRKG
jgi:hypothetical protein